jgi:arginyl-tRNA synthetase
MKKISSQLEIIVSNVLKDLYGLKVEKVDFQETRREFEGDITLVIFPFVKVSKKGPEATANEIGAAIMAKTDLVTGYQVVKGFLNLSISDGHWLGELSDIRLIENFGYQISEVAKPAVMVEYSSPNTNKPLHLGHVRNNLLGFAVSKIIEAAGTHVQKVQIINDRGIHICKSMLAWQKLGNGETPESTGLKGDKLVGNYYVAFDKAYRAELAVLMSKGLSKEEAERESVWMQEARDMLLRWEQEDPEVIALWETMNGWVYAGFDETYKKLGVSFDHVDYESNTYLLGKKAVAVGLERGVFFQKADGSVWIDLTSDGLDEKLLLRSDGTSVYMTQDIGTAIQRFQDFPIDGLTYVVGNEQDYHFKVLFLILKKLGYAWAEKLYHLSYGMVDLPSGKMKSREGTVVDADELIDDMVKNAAQISESLGKMDGYPADEKERFHKMIGDAALKYFILKVDPKKRMMFNPEESIDFNGNTGPFIQYTYARIRSLERRYEALGHEDVSYNLETLETAERLLIRMMTQFPDVIEQAAKSFNPSLVANYVYDLVKQYNSFYQQFSIFNAERSDLIHFRMQMSSEVAGIIKRGMALLGIDCPERM